MAKHDTRKIRELLKTGHRASELVKQGFSQSTVYEIRMELFGPVKERAKSKPVPVEITRRIDNLLAIGLAPPAIAKRIGIKIGVVHGYMAKMNTSTAIEQTRRATNSWPSPSGAL